MTYPAAGSITLAEEDLRNTLAAAVAFREFVAVEDEEAALARIYVDALPPPTNNRDVYSADELAALRPYALVWTDPDDGFTRQQSAGGYAFHFRDTGRLHVEFVADVAEADLEDAATAQRKFKNALGEILDNLAELAGQPGYLTATGFKLMGPVEIHPDTETGEGPGHWGKLIIDWGLGG